MKRMPVGEFKARFSSVLREVEKGNPVAITYGRKRATLAVLVPYRQYAKARTRALGVLADRATCRIHDDFRMSDEECLVS